MCLKTSSSAFRTGEASSHEGWNGTKRKSSCLWLKHSEFWPPCPPHGKTAAGAEARRAHTPSRRRTTAGPVHGGWGASSSAPRTIWKPRRRERRWAPPGWWRSLDQGANAAEGWVHTQRHCRSPTLCLSVCLSVSLFTVCLLFLGNFVDFGAVLLVGFLFFKKKLNSELFDHYSHNLTRKVWLFVCVWCQRVFFLPWSWKENKLWDFCNSLVSKKNLCFCYFFFSV